MRSISCGIDFGTSNSSVAIASDQVQLVPVEGSDVTIPSALFFRPGQPTLFGRQAVEHFLVRSEGRFMRSLKRVLGTSLMKTGTMVNGKVLRFETIIGLFLSTLRQRTNAFTETDISNVVMGRPVHFVDNNAAADKNAEDELRSIALAVGFKVVEFQYEPIAAAFAHESNIESEKLALVVDLGGGTSDFTIIRLSRNLIKSHDRSSDILANTGVRVGGNDFDKALSLEIILPELGYGTTYGQKNLEVPLKYYHDLAEWSKVNFLYTPKNLSHVRQLFNESHAPERFGRLLKVIEQESGHTVLSAAEASKIALTDRDAFQASMDFLERGFAIDVSRNHFENVIQEDVSRISSCAMECVRLAGLSPQNIELVILTGGSTEIPLVQRAFKKMFPQAGISDKNKLSSVGLGLAFDSARKFK